MHNEPAHHEPTSIYIQKALNDATGGVPSMLHDCDLALVYIAKWRVPEQQHRRRFCGNCTAKFFLIGMMWYSVGAALFYLWASYEDCIISAADGQLAWISFAYALISIIILVLQGVKYFVWYLPELDGGLGLRGPEVDNDRKYQALSSIILVFGVIQALALIQFLRQLLASTGTDCFEIILVRYFVISQIGLFGLMLCVIFSLRCIQVSLVMNPLPVQKLKKQQDDARVALAVGDMRKFEEDNNLTSNSPYDVV